MDRKSKDERLKTKEEKTLRQQMVDVAKKINWIPKFGLDRELDWLKNMHDWLISKKRYWGLALPIWECTKCGHFEVIGSKDELKQKAIEGWSEFEGKSPHRPQIDVVKIKCPKCGEVISRVPDVGNVWLDAGIVPISTIPPSWYPADFITESFPGQFKNWFYSMIAMATVLKNSPPYKTVLGFATLLDEKGEEMHKSKGNAIEFNEAADKIGVDVMRWMYLRQNPVSNLLFGYHRADEVRRRFYLILWNSYKFFIDYANLATWNPNQKLDDIKNKLTVLDKWILASLAETILSVHKCLGKYDAAGASETIERFVIDDLSTWYIRRSRTRTGPTADKADENVFLTVIHHILVDLVKLLAPFTPFVAEEIYKDLTGQVSVHLSDYPQANPSWRDKGLIDEMKIARKIVEASHAKRKSVGIKVRQPLSKVIYGGQKLPEAVERIIADEVNVKNILLKKDSDIELDIKINKQLEAEGEAREIVRQIQQARKEAGCALDEQISVTLPSWPKEHEDLIKKETLSKVLVQGPELKITRPGHPPGCAMKKLRSPRG